jgi:membrane dipeptidase
VTAATAANRVQALLGSAPVFDGHNDLPWALRRRARYDLDKLDIAVEQSEVGLHTDLPRLRAGGVGAQFWSVFVPCSFTGDAAVAATLEQIDAVHHMVERYADDLVIATTADEVEGAVATRRIASLLGMEGGHSIACSLGTLRMMYKLGVRYLTLTHNRNTPWADSATDTSRVGGLSAFGREVVRECNHLGMLVDLSHVATSTMHAALDVSSAPAFFSHSGARAVCDHPRNVPDDVLLRVRDGGGIIMTSFVPAFLNEECRDWYDRLSVGRRHIAESFADGDPGRAMAIAKLLQANPRPPCDVGDVADHIEHVRKVAGVDHVGLGGDFDGTMAVPDGLDGVHAYPVLLTELASRGWSDADLAKLTWHNAVRVLRVTERSAAAAQQIRGPSLATFAELDRPSASC